MGIFAVLSLFTSILSITEIGMSNFMKEVREDPKIWVIAVVNRTEEVSQEFIKEYEQVPAKTSIVKFGILYMDSQDGAALMEGIPMKTPSTIIFTDTNPSWDFVTSERMATSGELVMLIEYFTKSLTPNTMGELMKIDKNSTEYLASEKAEEDRLDEETKREQERTAANG